MSKFKYNLNHQISLQPRSISIRDIEVLVEKQGISRSTFIRDRNIRLDSTQSIPSDRLDLYAKLFECTPEALKNYKVEATSIREMMSDKITDKSGLS